MARPVLVLCTALALAAAPARGSGPAYHYRYGDEPPPAHAPGYHWYKYAYGGVVDPRAGKGYSRGSHGGHGDGYQGSRHSDWYPRGYANGYGHGDDYGKRYVKIYNYGAGRRGYDRPGYHRRPYGDDGRGYARDYDYGQGRNGFKYVREYYKDHSHHRERHYGGDYGHRYPYGGGYHDKGKKDYTIVVLGSKKGDGGHYPRGERRPWYRDGYGGGYQGGHHGGGRNYYGGGGFVSLLDGREYSPGGGTHYYGGGGFHERGSHYEGDRPHGSGYVIGGIGHPSSSIGRGGYYPQGGHGGSYHDEHEYRGGGKYHHGGGLRHGGGYNDYGGGYRGGSLYRSHDDDYVSLGSNRHGVYHYVGNDDRHYRTSHNRKIYY